MAMQEMHQDGKNMKQERQAASKRRIREGSGLSVSNTRQSKAVQVALAEPNALGNKPPAPEAVTPRPGGNGVRGRADKLRIEPANEAMKPIDLSAPESCKHVWLFYLNRGRKQVRCGKCRISPFKTNEFIVTCTQNECGTKYGIAKQIAKWKKENVKGEII